VLALGLQFSKGSLEHPYTLIWKNIDKHLHLRFGIDGAFNCISSFHFCFPQIHQVFGNMKIKDSTKLLEEDFRSTS
jgi:hypothetical protein